MIIAVDVDSVSLNLLEEWLSRYNRDYDDVMSIKHCLTWDIHNHVKKECGREIYKYLHDPDLYDYCKPIVDFRESIIVLREMGHRVVFATSTNISQQGKKFNWLVRQGILDTHYDTNSSDYVEAYDKSLIRADILIDDHVKNIESFIGKGVLFGDYPYNAHYKVDNKNVYRAFNWKEVITLFRYLEKT